MDSPPSYRNRSIYSVGAIVEVDPEARTGRRNSDGGKAFVKNLKFDGKVDVEYILDHILSQDIVPARLHVSGLATQARRRKGEEVPRPSLLSGSHRSNLENRCPKRQPASTQQAAARGFAGAFEKSRQWTSTGGKRHPLMEILRRGKKNKDRGWLRAQEAEIANRSTPKPKSHLLTMGWRECGEDKELSKRIESRLAPSNLRGWPEGHDLLHLSQLQSLHLVEAQAGVGFIKSL
jgi:hypothetical protein